MQDREPEILGAILRFVEDESEAKWGKRIDTSGWKQL